MKPGLGVKMEKQLVIFELAGEHFWIDVATVEGIIKVPAISKIPQAPDYIEGITKGTGKN
jgi:purine-binding chemotaxis protein CheW